jgi:hypothetical protein
MRITTGRVLEIQLDQAGQRSAWVDCPDDIIPEPGRYLLAWDTSDHAAPLATPLYLMGVRASGFLTAPSIPITWEPGCELRLQGPAGHGFSLPDWARRVAFVPQD